MADRPNEPSSAPRPYNAGREDTVVRPLPPMPAGQGTSNGAPRNGAASSAPPKPPVTRPVEAPVPPATSTYSTPVPAQAPAAPAKPSREERRAEKQAQKQASIPKPGRRARLRLTRVDPWSVMKTSFLLAIALGIVTVVSVLMVWTVLGAADVWSSINQTVQDVVGGQEASTFDIEDYLGTRRVVGFTMIVAAVDVILITAIATLGAFLYNMSASLLGGIEVTLAEDN